MKIAFCFLIPVVVGIYHWYSQKQFSYLYSPQFQPFATDKIVGDALLALACTYFLWHAFRGRPTGVRAHDSFATGVVLTILAISLTLSGFGYERHASKIAVVAFLYAAAAILFWWAYKGYPLGVVRDRN